MEQKYIDLVQDRIDELTAIIESYAENGGNIYTERRELPYYERLRGIVRTLRKLTGQDDISYEDVYGLCGIKFDREWNDFMDFAEYLTTKADENNCVDDIRSYRGKNSRYQQLIEYAKKYNTNPLDFLVLMTPYSFKEAFVKGDYISALRAEINQAYPTGDVGGIRWDRPDLYEKIRHLQKYTPSSTKQELLVLLGVENDLIKDDQIKPISTKGMVLKQLEEAYPDHEIVSFAETNPTLYIDVIKHSRSEGKLPMNWLSENGFNYTAGINASSLSKTKVDTQERARWLRMLKRQLMATIDLSNADDIDKYHAHLEATKQVIEYVNSLDIGEQIKRASKFASFGQRV